MAADLDGRRRERQTEKKKERRDKTKSTRKSFDVFFVICLWCHTHMFAHISATYTGCVQIDLYNQDALNKDKTYVFVHRHIYENTLLGHEITDVSSLSCICLTGQALSSFRFLLSFFSFFTLVRSLAGYSLRPHLLPFLWIDVALCVSLCVCAFFMLHVECLSSSSYYGSSCVWCSWFLKILPKHFKTQSSRNVTSPSNYALWNVTWMHLNAHLWRHPHPQLF